MGIHLHKAIGWAVPCPNDPLDRDSRPARLTLADHAVWLRMAADALGDESDRDDVLHRAELLRRATNRYLSGCVIHVPRLDGGTLLVIPPTYLKDWHRMDDDLDCAFAQDGPGADRITYTRSNPFAFDHLWMDAETGRTLAGPAGDAVTGHGTKRGDQAAARVRFQGGTAPAYSSPEEAAQRIVPGLPREVVHLIRHLGDLLAPDQLLGLRPARAVWMG